MAVSPRSFRPRTLGVVLLAFLLGCVSPPGDVKYQFFGPPEPDDAWTPKIGGWQSREQAEPDRLREPGPASVSKGGTESKGSETDSEPTLRVKYTEFRSEHRRAMARGLVTWIQQQSKGHYIADGAIDHWATLEETLQRDGDDCDGLELLSYNFLRDLGFGENEVYRAIVYRAADRQHHMVTFWFEDPDDPWVIDPTGAMTSGMPHLSEVPGWVPLKVFSETEEFTVRRLDSDTASQLAARTDP
jgi:hypothetical protein